MLIKNIEFSGHQRNTKTQFSQKAHVSWFTAIHHLKAEIESFKMVCNMPLRLFLTETKESPKCEEVGIQETLGSISKDRRPSEFAQRGDKQTVRASDR